VRAQAQGAVNAQAKRDVAAAKKLTKEASKAASKPMAGPTGGDDDDAPLEE